MPKNQPTPFELDNLGYVKNAVVDASEIYALAEEDKWPIINTITEVNSGTIETTTLDADLYGVCALDVNTAVIVYVDPDDTTKLLYNIVDRAAGSSIASQDSGTLYTGTNLGSNGYVQVVAISATVFAAVFRDDTATPELAAIAASWDGAATTIGSKRTIKSDSDLGASDRIASCYVSASSALAVVYSITGSTNDTLVVTADVSGTTISAPSSEATVDSFTSANIHPDACEVPGEEIALVAYRDVDNSNGKAVAVDTSGATPSVGTTRAFTVTDGFAGNSSISIRATDSTKAIVIYTNNSTDQTVEGQVFTITGGELDASPTKGTLVSDAGVDYLHHLVNGFDIAAVVDSNRVLFSYRDSTNIDHYLGIAELTGTPSTEQVAELREFSDSSSGFAVGGIDSLNAVAAIFNKDNLDLELLFVRFRQ